MRNAEKLELIAIVDGIPQAHLDEKISDLWKRHAPSFPYPTFRNYYIARRKRAEPEAAKESETQMSEETKRCPCYNDPCDPEGCNGSTKEFVDGRCLQVLHRDMKKDPDWREWVEYVIEKSFYADQERKEIACYDRMFEEIERKSAAPEAANHDPQLTEEK